MKDDEAALARARLLGAKLGLGNVALGVAMVVHEAIRRIALGLRKYAPRANSEPEN